MKNMHKIIFTFTAFLIPTLIKAEGSFLNSSTIGGVITEVTGIIGSIQPLLMAAAFLVFFWGLSKFILNSNKPEEIKNGKNYMVWGILALFILLTYMTIIGLVSNELDIGPKDPIIPILPTNAQTTP
jgi:mannitol-specific phosphotransferase system IIBC component